MRRRTLFGETEYGEISASLSYEDIKASGGESYPTLRYSQTIRYPNGNSEVVESGASVTYSDTNGLVSASDGTAYYADINEATSRKAIDTVTATIRLNGKTATAVAVLHQKADEITYLQVDPRLYYPDISATGGSAAPTLTYSQTISHSNGNHQVVTTGAVISYSGKNGMTDPETGVVTCESANLSESRIVVETVTLDIRLNGMWSGVIDDIYQKAWSESNSSYMNTPTSSMYAIKRVNSGLADISGMKIYATYGSWDGVEWLVAEHSGKVSPNGEYCWFPFREGILTGKYYISRIVPDNLYEMGQDEGMKVCYPVSRENNDIPSDFLEHYSGGVFHVTNDLASESVVFYIEE